MVKYIFASLISFLRVVLNNAMLTGFAKDEWKDTTSLLRTYSQKRGNIVKVRHENGVVNMIILQHARQCKLFELFEQMLQIDLNLYGPEIQVPTLQSSGKEQLWSWHTSCSCFFEERD